MERKWSSFQGDEAPYFPTSFLMQHSSQMKNFFNGGENLKTSSEKLFLSGVW